MNAAKKNAGKKIESLISDERWKEARELIQKELGKTPKDHWLLDRLSVTHYEERDYHTALETIEKAKKLAPTCPLVLWDYAGCKEALGEDETAIATYFQIFTQFRDSGRPREKCAVKAGPEWMLSLVVDCFYRLGGCFQKLGKNDSAISCFEKFLELTTRFAAIQSIYTTADAIAHLQALDGDVNENITDSMDEIMEECNLVS